MLSPCPPGCFERAHLLTGHTDPDLTTAPTSPATEPENTSSPTPHAPGKQDGTGDPGPSREGFRLRLQLKGQWRSVRAVFDDEAGQVAVHGNGDLHLYTATVPTLEDAVQTAASVLLSEFRAGDG